MFDLKRQPSLHCTSALLETLMTICSNKKAACDSVASCRIVRCLWVFPAVCISSKSSFGQIAFVYLRLISNGPVTRMAARTAARRSADRSAPLKPEQRGSRAMLSRFRLLASGVCLVRVRRMAHRPSAEGKGTSSMLPSRPGLHSIPPCHLACS